LDIWQESVPIRFASVDGSDRLTLGAAFGFFQEAAISHAEALGVGRDALTKNGQAWVLSRFSAFFEARPRYEEIVTVKTWPRGPEKLFALRDYLIEDNSEKTLVRGRGAWLVIDVEKRRPMRIEPVMQNLPLNEGRNAFNSVPPSLAAREDLIPAGIRQAAYSDIDFYGHVNNVRYVQWILDITPPELLNKAGQMRLNINYLNETLPGEKVELYSAARESWAQDNKSIGNDNYPAKPDAAFVYEGRRSGLPVFRAEIIFGS
jgi:acyl-ACP thioesterase